MQDRLWGLTCPGRPQTGWVLGSQVKSPEGSGGFHQRDMAVQYQEHGLWNQTPGSTTHWLCDPGRVTQPLCVSVPHLQNENHNTHFTRLL